MKIKRFNESLSIKAENIDGEITLYRLSSHSVIDLSEPGEYYVTSKSELDPEMLKNKKSKELFIIKVKTDSSNIDLEKSEKECSKFNNTKIVAVKNDNKCKLISVEPYYEIFKTI